MIRNDEQEQTSQPRVNQGWLRPTLIVLGGVILVAGVAVFFLLYHTNSTSSTPRPSVSYTPPDPPEPLTASYKQLVLDQVAQGFHLPIDQLKTKLRANPNGLFGVAHDANISDDQLATILKNAFQSASNSMVTTGTWSEQQASTEMSYWNQRASKALAGDVTTWFLG